MSDRGTNGLLAAALMFGMVHISALHAQETVAIGLSGAIVGNFAPVYAAEELGFYREQGIKAEITAYRGGADAQQALSVGAADVTDYFGAGVALAVNKGAKEKIVATLDAGPDAWHLIVDASSPIHSVKDLAGKKVGITTKASTTDAMALWAAKRAGIQFQTVPVGADGEIPMLKSKQVDAVSITPPGSLELLASGYGRSLVDYGKEMDPFLSDVWAASQDMIDNHPDRVRKTLTAIYKALDYMRKNPDWALAYLKKLLRRTTIVW